MNRFDQPLPPGLAALAREQDRAFTQELPSDSWLEALVQGDLSTDQLAELEHRAASDDELARAVALFSPASAAQLDHLTTLIGREITPPVPLPRPRRTGARDLRRWFSGASLALAAAAGIAVFVSTRGSQAPLPEYRLIVTGGEAPARGTVDHTAATKATTGGAPLRLWRDGELDVVLRPRTTPERPIAVSLWVARPGVASLDAVPAPATLSPTGAVHLVGPVANLFPADLRGPTALLIVVHGANLAPDEVKEIAATNAGKQTAGSGPGWQRFVLPIDLIAPAR